MHIYVDWTLLGHRSTLHVTRAVTDNADCCVWSPLGSELSGDGSEITRVCCCCCYITVTPIRSWYLASVQYRLIKFNLYDKSLLCSSVFRTTMCDVIIADGSVHFSSQS